MSSNSTCVSYVLGPFVCSDPGTVVIHCLAVNQGPNVQNILRKSYDYPMIMPKSRSTYDRRLVNKTCDKKRKAFLGYDSLAKL